MQVAEVSVFCILLCVCSLGAAQLTLQTCGDENSDITCSFFFRRVDNAFRDETVLYTLRKSFFPTEGAPPALFDIFMTLNIESVPNITCSDRNFAFAESSVSSPPEMNEVCNLYTCDSLRLEWEHQWSKTIVSFIIERENLELLQDTNFVAFSAATFNRFDTSVFSQEEEDLMSNMTNNTSTSLAGRQIVRFLLNIDFLPCRPDDSVLLDAWEDILPWIELYAKNSDNLENVEYSQPERGYAFLEGNRRRKGLTLPLLTVIHILLNAVFSLAATYLLSKYHNDLNEVKGKRYQLVASMYWAVVFMCLIGSIVIIVGNGYLYYALLLLDDKSLEVFSFRVASDITVGVLAVIEFIASILTPHNPSFFIPHLIRRTLCCNQCCYCCGSQSRRHILRKAILSVAMWIILLFLQLVISSLLPSAIVVVINPVPSLAFLSIMVALFFCMVVFIAYFLNAFEGNYISRHRLSDDERRKSSVTIHTLSADVELAGTWARSKLELIAQAFVFLVIFVIVALVVIIYLNFVRAGAQTNNVAGLFFSLVPSVALGGITWAAKRHLFREFEEEEEETTGDDTGNMEEAEEVKQSFLQVGGISIGRKTRRKSRRTTPNKKTTDTSMDLIAGASTTIGQDSDCVENRPADTAIDIDQPETDTAVSNGRVRSKEVDQDTTHRIGRNENNVSSVEVFTSEMVLLAEGKVDLPDVGGPSNGKINVTQW